MSYAARIRSAAADRLATCSDDVEKMVEVRRLLNILEDRREANRDLIREFRAMHATFAANVS